MALAKFSKPEHQLEGVIVKFMGWFENDQKIFVAMEYFALGDLQGYVPEGFTEQDIKDITLDLLDGLKIMHKEKFTHRDLKPRNIFVVQKRPEASRW